MVRETLFVGILALIVSLLVAPTIGFEKTAVASSALLLCENIAASGTYEYTATTADHNAGMTWKNTGSTDLELWSKTPSETEFKKLADMSPGECVNWDGPEGTEFEVRNTSSTTSGSICHWLQ